MKTPYKYTAFLFAILALFLFSSEVVNAYPGGISGATHKSGNSGCGCHGGSYFNTSVSVVIDGPDTLVVNQIATYTVTVSGGPYTQAGVDIAASNDNLVPVSTYLHVMNNELTHTSPVNYVSGQVVFEFTYTAPDTALPQMLYATGSSRKYWNWAVDKPVVIIPDVPVELVSFNASVINNQIILNWQTSTETNNRGFTLERKLNSGWQNVSFIQGNGTTTRTSQYNFVDNTVPQDYSGKINYRLNQIDYNGTNHYSNTIEINYTGLNSFALLQNYPNPFNPTTLISYNLPKNGMVVLKVYDALGREVKTLVNGFQQAGTHSVSFDAFNLSSGIYYYKMEAENNFSSIKKMILLR